MLHSTWRITCRPVFSLTLDEQRFLLRKYIWESGKASNGGSRERALGGAEFQRSTPISESTRISIFYVIKSNKDQTFINKSCSLFFSYRGICRFCASFGGFEGMAAFRPLGSAFERYGSPPAVNTYIRVEGKI